jgi:hypothetical protein
LETLDILRLGGRRRQGLDPLAFGDRVAPAVPVGLFFGRIANFINGELWGRPSDMPWAMVFPTGGDVARHPSQLYQAALEGVAIDDLLVGGLSAKAEATIDPGARVEGTVVSVGPDTAFVDLGGRRQGALKLANIEDVPNVGDVLQFAQVGCHRLDVDLLPQLRRKLQRSLVLDQGLGVFRRPRAAQCRSDQGAHHHHAGCSHHPPQVRRPDRKCS